MSVICAAAQYGICDVKIAKFAETRVRLFQLLPLVEVLFANGFCGDRNRTRSKGRSLGRVAVNLRNLLEVRSLESLIARDNGDLLPLLVDTSETIYNKVLPLHSDAMG